MLNSTKNIIFLVASICSFATVVGQESVYQRTQQELNNPKSRAKTLVAAHRGDWRNAPENSIQSLENAIKMGAHLYELDVQLSKDSVLFLMHDKSIDRTTNKKGKVSDFTCKELQTISLKNGLGRVTNHKIPSLEAFMKASKGRIFLNIDKGFQHFDLVIQQIQNLKMEDDVYISVAAGNTLDSIERRFGIIPSNIRLMPIVNINNKGYKEIVASYLPRKNTMFQAVFNEENAAAFTYLQDVKRSGYLLWYNSLWSSLCAGRDDDRAVEMNEADETWGWLIQQGADVIQSDRPIELLQYLNTKQ